MNGRYRGTVQTTSDASVRPKWRTPMLTEDAVADVTMNVSNVVGSDGYDASPGYSTSGNS